MFIVIVQHIKNWSARIIRFSEIFNFSKIDKIFGEIFLEIKSRPSSFSHKYDMLSFSQCEYFSTITVKLSITLCLQWGFIGYILYCLQLLSPVYLLTLMFTCAFIFIMWIFSAHYCTIVYIHCYIESSLLHTILIIIILPSILTLLYTYASFSQCEYYFTITTNWLYHYLHRIFTIYIRYCLQLVSPINLLRCLHMLSF